jgi:uncharacterized membrane protein YccF (DUF307 family)
MSRPMTLLLNLLWIFLGGGLLIALEYLLAGLLLCVTIVGIPFGLQCFKLAGLALTPFGRDVETSRGAGVMSFLFNVVWLLLAGIWICISHIVLAAGLAVTIIGLPFAFQHLKFAMVALAPFGQRVK